MLSYPLGYNMSAAVLADDLSFYDGITDQGRLLSFAVCFCCMHVGDLRHAKPSMLLAGGPAMTWSLFAIGWLNQGTNDTKSRHYFSRFAPAKQCLLTKVTSCDPFFCLSCVSGYANVNEPFKVWTETPTGGAVNFITGKTSFCFDVLHLMI